MAGRWVAARCQLGLLYLLHQPVWSGSDWIQPDSRDPEPPRPRPEPEPGEGTWQLGWAEMPRTRLQVCTEQPRSSAAAQQHNHQKVKESTLVKKQLAGRGGAGRGGEALVCTGEAAVVASSKQPLQAPTSARRLPLRPLLCRAANVGSRRFHNYGEGLLALSHWIN